VTHFVLNMSITLWAMAVEPSGCRRLLLVARPLEQLDGPEGVVREVGLPAAAGAGDIPQYIAEVPEIDPGLLGLLQGILLPTPRHYHPCVVVAVETVFPQLAEHIFWAELALDEVSQGSALLRLLQPLLQKLW